MHGSQSIPGKAIVAAIGIVGLAACGQRHLPAPVAYDEHGARPYVTAGCADSEYVVVSNKSSHVLQVNADKPGANGWHGDYEKVGVVLPGAVDTLGHYRKELTLRFYFEDQRYLAGMPVPIDGLSVQCVRITD